MAPSIVALEDMNVIVTALHADAARIAVSEVKPVIWDDRLFSGRLKNVTQCDLFKRQVAAVADEEFASVRDDIVAFAARQRVAGAKDAEKYVDDVAIRLLLLTMSTSSRDSIKR